MKCFFILKNGYPNGQASVARVKSYAKGFKNENIGIEILLPVSSEKYGRKPKNTSSSGYDKNGIFYKYMSGAALRKRNIFLRKINDIYGYINTLFFIYTHAQPKNKDFIIVYEGGIIWHYLCAFIAHCKKINAIMELNELPYGTSIETKSTIRHRTIMLKNVFHHYDYFLAISEPLASLAHKYAPQAQIIKVPIIVEQNLQGEDWPNKPLYIFHSGTLLEQKDGILGMLEAFGIASKKISIPIYYYLTGNIEDSPHSKQIKQIISKYSIEENVKFTGFLSETELRRYQKNCFLTIINKYETQQNIYCFSTKMGEYFSFSKPVIITSVGEATNYLKDGFNAYIVHPNKPNEIADKIIEAVNNPTKNTEIGKNAHKLVEKEFNCNYQAKRIINLIKQES